MHRPTGLMAAAAALAAFTVLAGSASAQDLPGIQTPSHNIFCMVTPAMEGQPTPQLRCDIRQMTNRPPPPPANCPLAYGDSYFMAPTGPAALSCHGDTVANPSDPVLAYGTTWTIDGFSCLSKTTGLTCTNGSGHGFTMSREAQRAF